MNLKLEVRLTFIKNRQDRGAYSSKIGELNVKVDKSTTDEIKIELYIPKK